MHTVRSASRAGSAVAIGLAMRPARSRCPALRQVRMIRTAISPRLAISMRRMATALSRSCERAAASRRIRPARRRAARISATVPRHAGAHGVHQLHHLDDADDGVLLDLRADFDEGRRAGLGRAVEGAQQRRGHDPAASGSAAGAAAQRRGRGARRRWRRAARPRSWRRGGAHPRCRAAPQADLQCRRSPGSARRSRTAPPAA